MESVDAGELSVEDAGSSLGLAARVDVRPGDRTGRVSARREMSDATLVRAAQRGQEDAIAELFARHWDAAHRAAFLITRDRAAAEDIAQEAFLAALRALGRFDRRRPLRPWLHRIVVNRAIDWSRARRLRGEVDAAAVGELPGAVAAVGDARLGDVSTAVGELPIEQRAVVVLRYLLEFTPGEIAELLDVPRGTVNSRLRRGLDALARVLDDADGAPTADASDAAPADGRPAGGAERAEEQR